MTEGVALVLSAAWSVWAGVEDWRHRRIPNALIIGGLVLALAIAALNGADGVLSSLVTGALSAAFLLIPYLVRASGAGDVKMMFVAGVFAGSGATLALVCAVAAAGFLLAIGFLLFKAVNPARLRHIFRSAVDWRYDRAEGRKTLPSREDERCRVPFGAAIAAGLILVRLAAMGGNLP